MNSTHCNRVGYWWSEKKSRKLNALRFAEICRSAGLELYKIDLKKSLEEQGPFIAIVHKLSDVIVKAEHGDLESKAVCDAFQEYVNKHPEIVVIDPLNNVEKLLDRYQQYKLVEDSELQKQGLAFTPAFIELTTMNVNENILKLKAAGVDFPFVCKPSLAHGSTLAHQMCLIFNEEGLKDITIPCVAQKFIQHNAILYKLFIIGDKYFTIERPSLKNFNAGEEKTIFFDSHDISKPYSASALTELDDIEPQSPIIRPDKDKLDHIVQVLCNCLRLNLFGIDLIVDNNSGRYAIIDMNIFPGYNEVDNFFQLLCDLIVRKISLKAQGLPDEKCKPILANSFWDSGPVIQPSCHKFIFDSSSITNSIETSKAIIPHMPKCFCCPISGFCTNILQSNLSNMNGIQKNGNDSEKLKLNQLVNKNSFNLTPFHFPDNMQDDSGIETSDSCDEKKKVTAIRTVRRQHSRNCNLICAAVEETALTASGLVPNL